MVTEPLAKKLFRFGISLFILELVTVIILSLRGNPLSWKIAAMISASLLGGRMASIVAGLEVGIPPPPLILILFLFNLSWVLIVFPLFIEFRMRVREMKIVGRHFISTRATAEKQKKRVEKLGTWFIPFYIWLPFPWTGVLIGSVLGHLVGIPTKKILLIAVPSMLAGQISWVYGFESFFILTGTPGKILAVLLIIGFLAASYFPKKQSKKPE